MLWGDGGTGRRMWLCEVRPIERERERERERELAAGLGSPSSTTIRPSRLLLFLPFFLGVIMLPPQTAARVPVGGLL